MDECGDAEAYTLGLRLRWFPWLEIGFFLPIATSVLWGGWLAWEGHISIAAATAVTLYVQQRSAIGELISWLDEIQFAATSLARILGATSWSALSRALRGLAGVISRRWTHRICWLR